MNIIKDVTVDIEKKQDNELPSQDSWNDTPIPSMSSEEEVVEQQEINVDAMVKTHLRSNGGQHIMSFFQPLPSAPTVLPRTLKCDPSPNVDCTIDADAANEAGQLSSDDEEEDVIGTQPQLMQPEEPQIQQEKAQCTGAPSKKNKRPLEFAVEDEPEFNGCCDACLFYTIRCCDFFSLV